MKIEVKSWLTVSRESPKVDDSNMKREAKEILEFATQGNTIEDKNLCAVCGKSEKGHHPFVPRGCKCSAKNTVIGARPVCNSFKKSICWPGYCDRCGHHRSCHEQGK